MHKPTDPNQTPSISLGLYQPRWIPCLACSVAVVSFLVLLWGEPTPRLVRAGSADYGDKAPAYKPLSFDDWPKEQAPELVLLLSGQTLGYIQPCGCSRPQLGGLERRYNLIESLKARGWQVVALDLGDVASKKALHKQAIMKYALSMQAMEHMGYAAVGIGLQEYGLPLLNALASYTLQHGDKGPRVLGGNLLKRDENFPSGDNKGSMVGDWTLVERNKIRVGVASVAGPSTVSHVQKIDPTLQFGSNKEILADMLRGMNSQKVDVRVLLYQGTIEEATTAAKVFPQFQIILCPTVEEEPPAVPTLVGDADSPTMILGVGHKGRHVGLVGVFRQPDGKLSFRYKLVSVTEEFETPADKQADHPILKELQAYTTQLQRSNILREYPKVPHPTQVAFANEQAKYAGSEACMACHIAEYQIWKNSKHAHAYEALVKATRPSLRQFDGECIVCHTVGFQHQTGFIDAEKTPHLKNVGCENCHGPASLHVTQPLNPKYHAYLSPWKVKPSDRLPSKEKLAKLAEAGPGADLSALLTADEIRVLNRVDATCQKCHDTDNDPHFRFEKNKYWPMIHHTGFRPKWNNK